MKVSLKGRSAPCVVEQITAENLAEFEGVVSGPWVGAWVVSDAEGYVQHWGRRETIEKLYEPTPIRFQSEPGWLDRSPQEIKA
ncbi:hypothetical protein MARCHEWKA_02830 [Brevundimonas phage vB_BpoS-Marchewka]|uniref:Uncharacterized protein n=1 Tax=Brevundimonas phage vB_BpoS-Marchewka TaxID=2948604 RepID=A0A9E7N4K2_9CAUD|nr:hypothetical protein MARCHEWKA_02830 [Brevundimonas phage vB_BpoS-Marchewka]